MFNLPLYLILTSTLFLARVGADEEERAFLSVHGNNNETSGVWQAVRDISSDARKMRTLCERAHSQTKSPTTDVIDQVFFDVKTVSFTRYSNASSNPEPLLVDVVSYNVTHTPPNESRKKHFFYFTKGAKTDCIFFLIKWRRRNPIFRVGLHFCDVKVPDV